MTDSQPDKGGAKRSPPLGNDAFFLEELYPDAAALFTSEQRPISEAMQGCIVVLDASVLLHAYELKSESLQHIGDLYSRLKDEGRLIVPAQAAREFYKRKAEKVAEIVTQLDTAIKQTGQVPFSSPLRLLEGDEDYEAARKLSGEIATGQRNLRDALQRLKTKLEAAIDNDPVSRLYRTVLANSVVELPDDQKLGKTELLADLARRARLKIAPGWKDADKSDGGIGDLLIWKTILAIAAERKCDCIFVTEEAKPDWWVKAGGSTFQPRPELLVEYRQAADGRSFFLMPLSGALATFAVEKDVVEEVQVVEEENARSERLSVAYAEYSSRQMELQYLQRELSEIRSRLALLQSAREDRIVELERLRHSLTSVSIDNAQFVAVMQQIRQVEASLAQIDSDLNQNAASAARVEDNIADAQRRVAVAETMIFYES